MPSGQVMKRITQGLMSLQAVEPGPDLADRYHAYMSANLPYLFLCYPVVVNSQAYKDFLRKVRLEDDNQ